MKKLAYSLAFTCILVAPGVNAGSSEIPGPGCFAPNHPFTISGDEAIVTKTETADAFTFRFSATDIPDEAALDAAIAWYKNIRGFRSLQLGPDNVVVLTTDKTITAEDLQRLLTLAVRTYGHLGYEINS